MSKLTPLALSALMLISAPVWAQTADPATDPATETQTEPTADDGTFSRSIPEGLKANLSKEEIDAYQARLDAAATPQERNTIRQELQRMNQERHKAQVQATNREKLVEQEKKPKGLFENMANDFKNVVSGKAAKDARDADKTGGGKDAAHGGKDKAGGGKNGGKSGGGGNNGGGGGGGKNK